MYAVIQSGAKQYRVEEGDTIDVELLSQEDGSEYEFKEVLFLHEGKKFLTGAPYVSGYTVRGELVGTAYGEKVVAYKYKRRKNERKKIGHRQKYSRVKITAIEATK